MINSEKIVKKLMNIKVCYQYSNCNHAVPMHFNVIIYCYFITVCVCVCVCVCARACACVHLCIHVYIHVFMYHVCAGRGRFYCNKRWILFGKCSLRHFAKALPLFALLHFTGGVISSGIYRMIYCNTRYLQR